MPPALKIAEATAVSLLSASLELCEELVDGLTDNKYLKNESFSGYGNLYDLLLRGLRVRQKIF